MQKLNHKILDSIGKIEKSEWDLVFGDIPEGYDFFRTLESSNLEGFSFSYVLIYQGGEIRMIAPVFSVDFNLDIAVTGVAQKIIMAIRKLLPRFLILKTIFCGSPFGENGILGIKSSPEETSSLIQELIKVMRKICRQNNIPLIIFKDFLQKDLPVLEPLKPKGFFAVNSFPSVVNNLRFNSMEEYLASLSHNTRRDMRRKLKKATSAANLEVKIVDSVEGIINDVFGLYLNTYNAGNVKFERLTKEFFLNVARIMQPKAKFFLYFVEGKLAAFNLCLLHKDTLIDKFIGFDYDIAHKYNLYFFSWYYNVGWCLKNSISFYQVGQTDYPQKLRLGGKLIPLYAYIRHNNAALNLILRILARFLQPANFPDANADE